MAKALLIVKEDNIFVRDGAFSESGMIEALAQTAAARTGWLIQSESPAEGAVIPVGVIGSVKDFRLEFLPRVGEELETEIEVIHEIMNASVVSGVVRVNGKMACSAELKIFLTGENPQ